MKGNMNDYQYCRGPFPWEYVWTYDFCQFPRNSDQRSTYVATKTGSTEHVVKKLAYADPRSVLSQCVAGEYEGAEAAQTAEPLLPKNWFSERSVFSPKEAAL